MNFNEWEKNIDAIKKMIQEGASRHSAILATRNIADALKEILKQNNI